MSSDWFVTYVPDRTGRGVFRDILTEPQQTVLELLSRIVEIRTFYLG